MNLQEARKYSIWQMDEHNLLLKGWKFKFSNAKRRFGLCNHTKKEISLSPYLTKLNGFESAKDLILHEIAHALVGYNHGHDKVWKEKCKEIGAEPTRLYSDEVKTPPKKYIAVCPVCDLTVGYNRKHNYACKSCNRKSNISFQQAKFDYYKNPAYKKFQKELQTIKKEASRLNKLPLTY